MFKTVFVGIGLLLCHQAQAGPLHDAARDGDVVEVMALLAKGAKVNQADPLIGTPLHMAAMTGQVEVLEVLIAGGADVNRPGGMLGLSPLQMAAASSAEAVELLLAAGADVVVTDTEGNTPLHLAADAGKLDVVRVLINHGATIDASNYNGREPIEFAGAAGHFEVVEFLQAQGALIPIDIDPITMELAEADAAHGEQLFVSTGCSHCHNALQGGDSVVAPNLWAIVGAEKARAGTFSFSEALSRIGGTWTYQDLNAWLADPKRFAPGNKMSMAPLSVEGTLGVKRAADRADIIAFLRLQSEDPFPLPK